VVRRRRGQRKTIGDRKRGGSTTDVKGLPEWTEGEEWGQTEGGGEAEMLGGKKANFGTEGVFARVKGASLEEGGSQNLRESLLRLRKRGVSGR